MSSWLTVMAIGLMGGVAAGIQGPLASIVAKHVGVMGSIFIVHLGGAVAAALFLGLPGMASLGEWRSVPWYALGAGVLGLVLVGALSICIPRLGAASTITLIVVAQLAIGALLDHSGVLVEQVRPFELSRLVGFVVLLVGTWLVLR